MKSTFYILLFLLNCNISISNKIAFHISYQEWDSILFAVLSDYGFTPIETNPLNSSLITIDSNSVHIKYNIDTVLKIFKSKDGECIYFKVNESKLHFKNLNGNIYNYACDLNFNKFEQINISNSPFYIIPSKINKCNGSFCRVNYYIVIFKTLHEGFQAFVLTNKGVPSINYFLTNNENELFFMSFKNSFDNPELINDSGDNFLYDLVLYKLAGNIWTPYIYNDKIFRLQFKVDELFIMKNLRIIGIP
jgi:hypothetical protein